MSMNYRTKIYKSTQYVDEGSGSAILLLHGLFGSLSNFTEVINHFSKNHRVIVPFLPLYTSALIDTSLQNLVSFIDQFIEDMKLENIAIVGNSLGGHIALLYALKKSSKINSMILTASSGLFENSMGNSYPKKDYDYIKRKTEETFYNPKLATKELIDEVYEIVNDREKVLRVLFLAKSAIRNNLKAELSKIKVPVQLIWGEQDLITPPFVAEEFHKLLSNSEMVIIDKAGHAPMMEQPNLFIEHMEQFLNKNKQ